MATAPTENDDRIARVSGKEQNGTDPDRKAWLELLKLVLIFVGIFALVALLASLEPESAHTIDFQCLRMP